LVEFALVVVIVLLLLIGVSEFGRAWNICQVLSNAAREGARLAALPTGFTTAAAVRSRIDDYLTSAGMDQSKATITIGGAGVDGGTGSQVSILVTYPYQFLFMGPVIRLINPSSTAGADVTLRAECVMRNE